MLNIYNQALFKRHFFLISWLVKLRFQTAKDIGINLSGFKVCQVHDSSLRQPDFFHPCDLWQ